MIESILEVRAPTSLLHFGLDRNEIEHRVTEWLVVSLFTEERISSGKAARLLNISWVEFLALLRKRGIIYLDYSDEELTDEFGACLRLA